MTNCKCFRINNVEFRVSDNRVEIQVGDNWGNRLFTTVEKAREIWKAIRKGKIECHDRGLDTFITVNQIRNML